MCVCVCVCVCVCGGGLHSLWEVMKMKYSVCDIRKIKYEFHVVFSVNVVYGHVYIIIIL